MKYIDSKYSYEKVCDFLNGEENKEKSKVKHVLYWVYLLLKAGIFNIIFRFFVKFMKLSIEYTGPYTPTMYSLIVIYSIATIFLGSCILTKLLFKPFSLYLLKKNIVYENKYRNDTKEIETIYKNIDEFKKFIMNKPDVVASITDTNILIEYMQNGFKRTKSFYFGNHMDDILLDDGTIDFTKIDKTYFSTAGNKSL